MAEPICLSDLRRAWSKLPPFERNEILTQYIESGIYYLGLSNSTLNTWMSSGSFDLFNDKQDNYEIFTGDHIAYRYEIIKILGLGAYGLVIMAYDHKRLREVAIKIMRTGTVYNMAYSMELITYYYLRDRLDNRTNELSHMLNHFEFRGHACIVFELCHLDLYAAVKANGFRPFKLPKLKIIIRSVLKGLRDLHKVNLFHGDLKPDNLVLTNETSWHATVIDIGTSRFGYYNSDGFQFHDVYKSPEYLLHLPFGPPADIWSLACVAFELATGNYLFGEGINEEDQLAMIMEVLGVPPIGMIKDSDMKTVYFNPVTLKPRYCSVRRRRGKISINKHISPTAASRLPPGTKNVFTKLEKRSPKFVNFLRKCLALDPSKRLTATSALYHAWVRESTLPNISRASCEAVGASVSETTGLNRCNKTRGLNRFNGRLVSSTSLINCSVRGKCDNNTAWLRSRAKHLIKPYEIFQ